MRKWLKIAAEDIEEVNNVLMKNLNVDKIELDKLWIFVKKNVSKNGLLK